MPNFPAGSRGKCAGFSKVELAVVLVVISALLYVLLERVLYMQEMGEKSEVEETVRSINFALRLEAASRLARGPEPNRLPLEKENPIKWLSQPPRNYLGEFNVPPKNAKPAYWYYQPETAILAYRPNRSDHLTIEKLKEKELRFVIKAGGDGTHPMLVPDKRFAWFEEKR